MRVIAAILFLIALVIAPIPSMACDSVEIGAMSYHWDRDKNYNESNQLIGCSWKNANVRYFENSHGWDSFSIGYRADASPDSRISAGVEFGIVRGYRDKLYSLDDVIQAKYANWGELRKWSPALLPYVRYRHNEKVGGRCAILFNTGFACVLEYFFDGGGYDN